MRFPRLRTILLAPVVLFALFYAVIAVFVLFDDNVAPAMESELVRHETVMIFGASGTAGDGILKAALADPDIETIHVVTRRRTPRIDAGVADGKVEVTMHTDYLDYSGLREKIATIDTVFWAIGLSSLGVDEETYGMIHVDFPVQFVTAWLESAPLSGSSFHYISSSDISADSKAMWAREKIRAEQSLFALVEGSQIRVIAYRPDYIGPTKEEAHLGQDILYWFFAPVRAAVRATQIGEAMLEVVARGAEFGNGDKLSTSAILRYSDSYRARHTD